MKGTRIFYGCTALTSISLPELESIEKSAFYGCSNLASVSLPKVTNVGQQAFGSCSSLTTICLPKDTNMRPTDLNYLRSVTTLFLCNDSNDALATEEDIAKWTDVVTQLTTVFYDYQGEDGDYLDPNNYDQVWTRPSN